jgi:hypothetical protein
VAIVLIIAVPLMRMAAARMQPMSRDPVSPAERSVRRLVLANNSAQPLEPPTADQDLTIQSVVIGDPRLITPEDRRMAQWRRGQFHALRAQAEISAAVVWAQLQTTRDP